MKKNRLILIITIVLAVIAFLYINNNSSGTLSKSNSDFAIEDTSMVTKIFLTDKSNKSVILEKKSPGNWSLNNKFKASTGYINFFLKTLKRLEVKSPVAKAARNNVVKRLASTAIKVEIYQTVYRIDLWGLQLLPHEKLTKTYYVGDAAMDNMGTYMLLEGSDEPFIMHIPGFRGFLNSRYSTVETDWRDHSIFSFDIHNIKSVKLEFPSSPDSSYIVQSVGNLRFTLTALNSNTLIADYDTIKLLDVLSSLHDVKYELLVSDFKLHNKDSVLKNTPFHILTITDLDGKPTVITTYHKKPVYADDTEPNGTPAKYDRDRFYCTFNDGKDFAIIQFYVFDNILRPLTYFIKHSTKRN